MAQCPTRGDGHIDGTIWRVWGPSTQWHTYRLFCALECFLQSLAQREYDPFCLPTSWADIIGSGYFLLFKLVQSSSWCQPHMWFKTVLLACFRPLPCSKGTEWGVAHSPASSFSSFASPTCSSLESNRVFGQGGRNGAVGCWWVFNNQLSGKDSLICSVCTFPWGKCPLPPPPALADFKLVMSSHTTCGVGKRFELEWAHPSSKGWRIEGWSPLEWAQVQAALCWLPLPFWLTPVALMGWVFSGSPGSPLLSSCSWEIKLFLHLGSCQQCPVQSFLLVESLLVAGGTCKFAQAELYSILSAWPPGRPHIPDTTNPRRQGVSPLSLLPCSFYELFFIVITLLTPNVWVFHSELFSSSLQTPNGSIQSWFQMPSLMAQMV